MKPPILNQEQKEGCKDCIYETTISGVRFKIASCDKHSKTTDKNTK